MEKTLIELKSIIDNSDTLEIAAKVLSNKKQKMGKSTAMKVIVDVCDHMNNRMSDSELRYYLIKNGLQLEE